MDKEILVVIPYLASAAQGNELELAVTGWQLFFREPHRIVIVGDDPGFTGYGIEHIPCPRIGPVPGQYLPHLDHVHKFRTVRRHFPDSEGFIYTCDDIYPTAPFTMEDVVQPKEPVLGFPFKLFDWKHGKISWHSDKGKTGELCARQGLPVRNWVCHLPVYYEWDKLLSIYDRYDCDHVSYIVENIYFNMEYPDVSQAVSERLYHDEVKTSHPDIRPVGSVKWISNANSGWSEELERILQEHYESV